ncbi:unnamed protein product [Symbiodinium sp. CCMP2592]|nr:unnamed protein product [Symbiodinium sp. CCMP2592]
MEFEDVVIDEGTSVECQGVKNEEDTAWHLADSVEFKDAKFEDSTAWHLADSVECQGAKNEEDTVWHSADSMECEGTKLEWYSAGSVEFKDAKFEDSTAWHLADSVECEGTNIEEGTVLPSPRESRKRCLTVKSEDDVQEVELARREGDRSTSTASAGSVATLCNADAAATCLESARPILTIGSLKVKLANPPNPRKRPRFLPPGVGLSFKGRSPCDALQQLLDRYKGIGAVKDDDWYYITHAVAPASVRLTLVTPLVYNWRFEGEVCDEEMAAKKSAATAFTQDKRILEMAEWLAPAMSVLRDQIFEEWQGLRGRGVAQYARNSPAVTAESTRRYNALRETGVRCALWDGNL